jgi:GT2 family glycosyltransferase
MASDIIIISYNSRDLTLNCIKSLKDTADGLINKIIVVDNNSSDDTVESVKKKYPDVVIIENRENAGYAKAVNIGAKEVVSDYLIVSNADVIYHPGAVKALIEFLKDNPKAAVNGPQQQFVNGKWQYSYGMLPGLKLGLKNLFLINNIKNLFLSKFWKFKIFDQKAKSVQYVDGASMAFNKKIFFELNGFCEDYYFYTEEADFCKRASDAGYKVMFNPAAIITHYRGGSTGNMPTSEKFAEMFISSKIIYLKKYLNNKESKNYCRLEILYHKFLAFSWGLISLFSFGNVKAKALNRKEGFSLLWKKWKKALNEFK